MNEAKPDAGAVTAQQSMCDVKAIDELPESIDERVGAIGIVMQMYLDIRNVEVDQPCQAIDRDGVILLFGIEEGVTGRSALRVRTSSREARPSCDPAIDAFERGALVRAAPPRLEMIGDHHPQPRDIGSVPAHEFAQSDRAVRG